MQADQDLHCPLIESMYAVVSVDEQRMSRSDCMYVFALLDLLCLCMALKDLIPTLYIISSFSMNTYVAGTH